MKKTIAALLALLLCVSCLGLSVQAAEAAVDVEEKKYMRKVNYEMYKYYTSLFYEDTQIREFANPEQRVPNPKIPEPEELFRTMYIPRYKTVDMWLHVRAMSLYHFPPIIRTGDILPIDVKNQEEMLAKTGIKSYSKIKCAVELISVDETIPYRMVIATLKDQNDTKAICQEMVNNIRLDQWGDVEKLNAGVFGIHGEVTMIVMDEALFEEYAPYYARWARKDIKTYVEAIENQILGSYSKDNWTYFTWKLSDENPEA